MYIGTPVCTSSALQRRSRAVETHCFGRCHKVQKVNGWMYVRTESCQEGAFQSQG